MDRGDYPGAASAARALIAVRAAGARPDDAVAIVRAAIEGAVDDYRRCFARALVAEGVAPPVVWRAMGRVPVRGPIAAELVAPLSPALDRTPHG